MQPPLLLAILLVLTACALLASLLVRARRRRILRNLASQWHMTYVQNDLFGLTHRMVESFPIPGAADIRVFDIIHAQSGDLRQYVFTVEFTQGAIRTQERSRRVAVFCEPREGQGPCSGVRLAPTGGSLAHRYESARKILPIS